jgi:hypothetical protein
LRQFVVFVLGTIAFLINEHNLFAIERTFEKAIPFGYIFEGSRGFLPYSFA